MTNKGERWSRSARRRGNSNSSSIALSPHRPGRGRAPSPKAAAPRHGPPPGPPSAAGPGLRARPGPGGGQRPPQRSEALPAAASPRPGAPPRAHRPAHGLSSGGSRRGRASRARAEGRPGPTGGRRTAHVQGAAALRFRPVAATTAAGRERPRRRAVMASSRRATAAGSGRAPRCPGNVGGDWGGVGDGAAPPRLREGEAVWLPLSVRSCRPRYAVGRAGSVSRPRGAARRRRARIAERGEVKKAASRGEFGLQRAPCGASQGSRAQRHSPVSRLTRPCAGLSPRGAGTSAVGKCRGCKSVIICKKSGARASPSHPSGPSCSEAGSVPWLRHESQRVGREQRQRALQHGLLGGREGTESSLDTNRRSPFQDKHNETEMFSLVFSLRFN